METRSAQDLIDQAIRENRFGEFFLYGSSGLLLIVGVFALAWGIVNEQGGTMVTGSLMSAMFLPATALARMIRRENIAIRLLEAPLSMSTTAQDAAKVLQDSFVRVFIESKDISQKISWPEQPRVEPEIAGK